MRLMCASRTAGPTLLLLSALAILVVPSSARQLSSAGQTGSHDPALRPGVSWLFALDPYNSASLGSAQPSNALSTWLAVGPGASRLPGVHALNGGTGEDGQRRLLPLDGRVRCAEQLQGLQYSTKCISSCHDIWPQAIALARSPYNTRACGLHLFAGLCAASCAVCEPGPGGWSRHRGRCHPRSQPHSH